jgi:uncharacterized membrane protein YagU involved in acid resistance
MVEHSVSSRPVDTKLTNWSAAVVAGIVAGIVATGVQVTLWWLFLDDALPWNLYRDARLTAAMLMGPEVLPPPSTFNWAVLAIATSIHFILSVVYGLVLACLISRLGMKLSLATGVVYGLGIYVVNMYGMTFIFPWFSEVRDWITIITHAVFGLSLAGAYKLLVRRAMS